ncbi:uncharacterized protein RCC_02033 [Ramularia collo-cygni]|uniref:Uncharacterized protein n=1 Tax=Ramularia collo-cygni TaxID=112498 RepID=A0A2D3UN90_9PEZI|nr:uncharacterized protein RCC_02033 [Ramularia collo-cygni]CZT16191.1 uncharacterized protein RCC_02033 [Ramularia collo-cygni]
MSSPDPSPSEKLTSDVFQMMQRITDTHDLSLAMQATVHLETASRALSKAFVDEKMRIACCHAAEALTHRAKELLLEAQEAASHDQEARSGAEALTLVVLPGITAAIDAIKSFAESRNNWEHIRQQLRGVADIAQDADTPEIDIWEVLGYQEDH